MTLKEAIKWHEDKEAEYKVLAKEHEDFAMMAVHYQQLTGWLKEVETLREDVEMWSKDATSLQLSYNNLLANYKKAKRLLKAAVESMTESCSKDCHSCANKHHRCCEDDVCYKWEHEDEALALIGEDGEKNG